MDIWSVSISKTGKLRLNKGRENKRGKITGKHKNDVLKNQW